MASSSFSLFKHSKMIELPFKIKKLLSWHKWVFSYSYNQVACVSEWETLTLFSGVWGIFWLINGCFHGNIWNILVASPSMSGVCGQWTSSLVSTFFSFLFLYFSLSLLISMSIPPIFQSSHSICFSFNFGLCSFYYNFCLFQMTYKIGIVF